MKKNNPFSRGIKQKKRRIVEVEQIEQEEEYENEQNDNGIELVESDETDVQILPSVPRKNFEDQFPKIEKGNREARNKLKGSQHPKRSSDGQTLDVVSG